MHSLDECVFSSNCVPGTTQETWGMGRERTSRTDRCVLSTQEFSEQRARGRSFSRWLWGGFTSPTVLCLKIFFLT